MKLIYVASPYAGDVEKNVDYAKQACRTVMESGNAFFAPCRSHQMSDTPAHQPAVPLHIAVPAGSCAQYFR